MKEYKQVLPIRTDCRIDEQFGWLPLSVLEPTKESKAVWSEAYLDDGENESRRSNDAEYLPGLKFSEFHAGVAELILRYWSMKGSVVVDPFAGSYHIEALTDEIYSRARQEIGKIESMGGALKAIEQGYQQQEIHTTAYRYFNEIERGTRKIVGVNHGTMQEQIQIKPMKLNPEVAKNQIDRLNDLRRNRDNSNVRTILESITEASESGENLFPYVLEAVRANATLGEIMKAMKDVFGTYSAPSGF